MTRTCSGAKASLPRSAVEREVAGVMLNEEADEPLKRAERRLDRENREMK